MCIDMPATNMPHASLRGEIGSCHQLHPLQLAVIKAPHQERCKCFGQTTEESQVRHLILASIASNRDYWYEVFIRTASMQAMELQPHQHRTREGAWRLAGNPAQPHGTVRGLSCQYLMNQKILRWKCFKWIQSLLWNRIHGRPPFVANQAQREREKKKDRDCVMSSLMISGIMSRCDGLRALGLHRKKSVKPPLPSHAYRISWWKKICAWSGNDFNWKSQW